MEEVDGFLQRIALVSLHEYLRNLWFISSGLRLSRNLHFASLCDRVRNSLDDPHVLQALRETGLRLDAGRGPYRGDEVFLDTPTLLQLRRYLDFSGVFFSQSPSSDSIRTEVVSEHPLTSKNLKPIRVLERGNTAELHHSFHPVLELAKNDDHVRNADFVPVTNRVDRLLTGKNVRNRAKPSLNHLRIDPERQDV